MPAQRQTNIQPYTACLVEARDVDGTIYPSCEVAAGESVDWPQPVAGFSGWDWEAYYAAEAAASSLAEPGAGSPADAASTAAKPRTKASVKATDTQEATA